MPIKPENRARYPKDWAAIRAAILLRADYRCEHVGEMMRRCTCRQYAVGNWVMSDKWRLPVGAERLQQRVLRWMPEHGNGPCDAAGQGLRWPSMDRWTFAEARAFAGDLDWDQISGESPKPIVIVLTVAHLNHRPEDCRPENLAALCQRHHLALDHDHHRANAQATRRAKAGTLELF